MSIRVALIAAMVVGLVATLVTIGSQAFFSDVETSVGNVAQAGVMDLRVNNLDDPIPALVNYTAGDDMKPSRFLQPVSVQLTNVGQNEGHLDLHYLNVVPSGGALSEPECTIQGGVWDPAAAGGPCHIVGDPSTPFTADDNDIHHFFEVDVHDYDPVPQDPAACSVVGGTWFPNPEFPALPPPGWCLLGPPIVPPTPLGPPTFGTPPGGIESFCIELGNISASATRDILLTFHLHQSADDRYQGDDITFDIEFTLHQDNDPVPHSGTPGFECGLETAPPVAPLGGGPPPPAAVAFSVGGSSVGEATPSLDVDVVLFTASPLAAPVTVDVVDLLTGTASPSGVDYTFASPETLTFAIGSTNGTTLSATLSPADDLIIEGDETVQLELQGVTGPAVIVAPTAHTVTIIDDDVATLQFDAPTSSVSEGTVSLTVDVRLDTTVGSTLSTGVSVAVNNLLSGSATPGGVDFTYSNTTLNFSSGAGNGITLSVTLSPVEDLLVEGPQTVDLGLSSVTGPASLSATNPTTHEVTIVDNDTATVAFLEPPSFGFVEDSLSSQPIEVVLSIVPAAATLASAVTVDLVDLNIGAAVSGSDYVYSSIPTTITFNAGSGDGDVDNTAGGIPEDLTTEPDEDFTLGLQSITGPATIATPSATRTIPANST